LDSFEEATKEPRQVAGLYFYQVLDLLEEMAYGIALDFRRRPQLYRDLGEPPIVPLLARLVSEYGVRVDIPSQPQRSDIFTPIFGASDTGSFSRLRDDLIIASKAFAERVADNSIDMLREVVRTSHRPFKDYLTGVHGDSVRFSKDVVLSDFTEKVCYPVLRNRAVAAVFGIAKLAAGRYPYGTDAAEDILIEAISNQLGPLSGVSGITREQISSLQRVAIRGAEAIATAIDFEEADPEQTDADLDLLISNFYSWGASLATIRTQTNSAALPAVQSPASTASLRSTNVVSRSSMPAAGPGTAWRPTPRPRPGPPPSS